MKNLRALIGKVWKKANEDMLFTHSASLTYYSFVYFVPILALFYFLFDYFNGFEKVIASIQTLLSAYLAPQIADTILSYVTTIQNRISAEAIGIFGIFGFIISSCLMLYQIEFSFNAMLNCKHTQHKLKRAAKYVLLMTGGPIFIGLSILTQQAVYRLSGGHIEVTPLSLLVSILPLVSTIIFMTVLYKWVSAINLTWKTCLKAGIFAGVGIEVLKQLYAYYVIYSLKGSAYGTMAVLPLFLIWINLIWTLILFGAQICSTLSSSQRESQ